MSKTNVNTFRNQPDEAGRFGIHGGRFVAETLMPLILNVEKAYKEASADKSFQREMYYYQKHYIGRPSPLYFAERMTAHFGGAKLYLKRDELNHTGAHKINNVLGQALLAKRMGKIKVIAETAQASMALPQQQPVRFSIWNAKSLWALKMSNGKSRMSTGCVFLAPKSTPLPQALARLKMR